MLNLGKCIFSVPKIKFLGNVVSASGNEIDPDKVAGHRSQVVIFTGSQWLATSLDSIVGKEEEMNIYLDSILDAFFVYIRCQTNRNQGGSR